jgi:hypothetical protein
MRVVGHVFGRSRHTPEVYQPSLSIPMAKFLPVVVRIQLSKSGVLLIVVAFMSLKNTPMKFGHSASALMERLSPAAAMTKQSSFGM